MTQQDKPDDVTQLVADLIARHGWTPHRATEVAMGQTSEADMAARVRLDDQVKAFGNPDDCWEQFSVTWSVDPAEFYHSEDGMTAECFRATYPNLTLVFVEADKLEAALTGASRKQPTYNGGRPDKTKRLLTFLSHGGDVSPPLVRRADDGQWVLKGGNHRFNLFLHQGGGRLPVLIETVQLGEFRHAVTVLEERPGHAQFEGYPQFGGHPQYDPAGDAGPADAPQTKDD